MTPDRQIPHSSRPPRRDPCLGETHRQPVPRAIEYFELHKLVVEQSLKTRRNVLAQPELVDYPARRLALAYDEPESGLDEFTEIGS